MSWLKDLPTNWQWLITLGAIIGSVFALIKYARTIFNYIVKKYDEISGIAAVRMQSQENAKLITQILKADDDDRKQTTVFRAEVLLKIGEIHKETQANGGYTIKDAINRLEARQRVRFYEDLMPSFEANLNGEFIWMNRSLMELTGKMPHELCGMGWVNIIHSDDREWFIGAWSDAVKQHRDVEESFTIIDSKHELVKMKLKAVRMLDGGTKIHGYFGTLHFEKST